jgi:hypothetical protein
MSSANIFEAQVRVILDERLREQGWSFAEFNSGPMDLSLPDRSFSDYVLKDRSGRTVQRLKQIWLKQKARAS